MAVPALTNWWRPTEPRPRQIEKAVLVLVDEAAALLVRRRNPAPPTRIGAAPTRLGLAAQHRVGLGIILRRDHGRAAALEDAGLLDRDLADRVAEIFRVVVADRGDDRGGGLRR